MILRDPIRTDLHGYMSGRSTTSSTEKPPSTSPTGRRCACGTRLSIYNHDDHCATCSTERWAAH